MRLDRTTLVYFVTQVSITVAGFGATFFIARFMGAASLGAYASALAMVYWLNVPISGVANAINKRVSEGIDPGEYLTAGVLVNLVVIAVGVGGIIAFAPFLGRYLGIEATALVALLFAAMGIKQTVNQCLKGQKRVAATGVLGAVERVLRTAFQIALVVAAGLGVGGLFLGHAGSLTVGLLLGLFLFRVRPSLPSLEHFRRIVEYARYSWLGVLESRAYGWLDTLVLTVFVSSTLVGIYEASWRLASTLGLIGVSIQQTLFPEISELDAGDDYERIHNVLSDGLAFSGVFAIPGLVGAAIVGPELLRIYRPEFSRGATVLMVLILARLVAAYGSQVKSTIYAVDRPDVAFRINVALIVTNLGLNVSLVWAFGWIGAAVATTLSGAVSLGIGYVALARIIGSIDFPVAEVLRQVFAAGIMGVVVYGAKTILPSGNLWTIVLIGIGAGVYLVALLAVSALAREKVVRLLPFELPVP